jgi:hypothetical protein
MSNDPALQMLLTAARSRTAQLRARLHLDEAERDKGALSIEMALLVGALVVIAGIIITILIAKVTAKGNAIN